MQAAGEEVRDRLLIDHIPAAASLLCKYASFEPLIACVFDPRDAEAAALLIALGREREMKEALARGEATGHTPAVVMVTERALAEAALGETRPVLAARIAAPVEEAGAVRMLCVAAGGASFVPVVIDVNLDAFDKYAAQVPAVVHRLFEVHGEQLRETIERARPDGQRQLAIVDVATTTATGQLAVSLVDNASFVEWLRAEAPDFPETAAEPPEFGFINVLFVLEDGSVFARPMRLALIVS